MTTSKELQAQIKKAKYFGYKNDIQFLKDYYPKELPAEVKAGSRLFVIMNRLAVVCEEDEDESVVDVHAC